MDFCFDVQHKTLRTKAYVVVPFPAGIFRDDSRFDFDFFAVSRRHYFAWHAIDITNPASQRLDCRCAPESLGIAELRTIAILMLDDLTPKVNLAVDEPESRNRWNPVVQNWRQGPPIGVSYLT
jgi:hypothetical protein